MIIYMYIYSQTCSYYNFYKMTIHPWQPLLILPKEIHIQLLLYKMTICLKRPVTIFCLPSEKNLSKTTATKQNFT